MSPHEDSTEANTWNKLDKFESRVLSLPRFVPIFTAIAAMVAAIGLSFIMSRDVRARKQAETEERAALERTLEEVGVKMAQEREAARVRTAELERTNADLVLQLRKLQDGTEKGQAGVELRPSDRDLINHIKSAEEQLQTRLGKLEEVLEDSPEKALTAVVIKQRLDSLQDRTRGDIDSIRGEIGRLFTLTQWFIGLIFTIALGLLGLAIANLRRPKPQDH
jgi:hypothetical protein